MSNGPGVVRDEMTDTPDVGVRHMSIDVRLRDLPLRTKLIITIIGAGVALLGASTYLSFRYWRQETLAATEHQTLVAAGAARASLDAALALGREDQARRSLRRLLTDANAGVARVYGDDGRILLSALPAEEGARDARVWLPPAPELPAQGLARQTADGRAIRAFLPLTAPGAAVFEVEFSVAPLQAAMDRGARLGIGLFVASVLALVAILFTMLEREVVVPLRRVRRLLDRTGEAPRREEELGALEAGVTKLLAKEAATERRLVAQAGLAEVGELAAEMAHELKRPLASAQMAIELLQREYVPDPRGQELLAGIAAQLERLLETMRDLFALARPDGLVAAPVDLPELLDNALLEMASHPAGRGLAVVREYGGDARVAWADPQRLEQAVLNVMLNAAEAMPGGGVLELRTERAEAGRVALVFRDYGPGIPEPDLERVLRPFHSTKPMGTGLGLPLVARIVSAHQGRLAVDSEPGKGTTVRIELPTEPPARTENEAWRKPGSSSSKTIRSSAR